MSHIIGPYDMDHITWAIWIPYGKVHTNHNAPRSGFKLLHMVQFSILSVQKKTEPTPEGKEFIFAHSLNPN